MKFGSPEAAVLRWRLSSAIASRSASVNSPSTVDELRDRGLVGDVGPWPAEIGESGGGWYADGVGKNAGCPG
jgi:hypothetical protein